MEDGINLNIEIFIYILLYNYDMSGLNSIKITIQDSHSEEVQELFLNSMTVPEVARQISYYLDKIQKYPKVTLICYKEAGNTYDNETINR